MELPLNQILVGQVNQMLKLIPDSSVDTCVTSPPYYGLRDYGVDGQIGLEDTPEEFINRLVSVFREVRRVLKPDGTLWVNMGDSYASTNSGNNGFNDGRVNRSMRLALQCPEGYKRKDLMGMPWMLAFALRADGWYLRQDIIWHKPNPMPESVTDRCTKSHEYIFLLSKSDKYYFDSESIKEDSSWEFEKGKQPDGWDTDSGSHGTIHRKGRSKGKRTELAKGFRGGSYTSNRTFDNAEGGRRLNIGNTLAPAGFRRNKRSVWKVATKPYKEAHFATFPPDLISPCILAGAPEGGVVLDPFFGSGTTGEVAMRANRNFIGIELNPEYVDLAKRRLFSQGRLAI